MADRTIMALDRPAKPAKGSKRVAANNEQRERVFDVFRRWGYYQATLDPLGVFQPQKLADLQLTGEAAEEARRIYCGNIGV
jgi:2-oxoglutarate dehydrogenase E1 component